MLQALGRDPTLTGRTEDWPIFLSILDNSLVGAGYETFWLGPRLKEVWETFPGMQINQAHNGYIEVLLNLGWIGVALLGILVATGYRSVIGGYRRAPDFGSLRLAFFLATMITAFTEAAFRMMGPPWIAFLLVTASVPVEAASEGDGSRCLASFLPERVQEPAAAVRESAPVGD